MEDKLLLGNRCRRRRWTGLLMHCAVALACCAAAPVAAASHCGNGYCVSVRPQDTIWLVNTRQLRRAPCQAGDPAWRLSRYESGAGWTTSSVETFHAAADPDSVTIVFLHGNRVDRAEAISHGMDVYRLTASQAAERTRLRFVIWSWPSDKVSGPIRDARVKAERTESEAYYVGRFLSPLGADSRVTLIGHSFGVRIATGSLQLLAEGSLSGRVLPRSDADARMPVRLVAIAGALDNNWLLPGCRHGMAVTLLDQMLIFYNPCDPVLKRYPWVTGSGCQDALGYRGLTGWHRLGEEAARFQQINAAPWIGKTHRMVDYLGSSTLVHAIGDVAFWE